MLSRFRRPAADLRIDMKKTLLHAGDELDARVTLLPQGAFHVRRGQVDLICVETYVQVVHTQYGPQYHKKTETLFQAGETFLEDETVRPGLRHSSDVRLVAPPDALPTMNGTPVRKIEPGISWAVTASLDVAGARDIQHSQQVTVASPPMPDDRRHQRTVAEAVHRSGGVLTLTLSQADARSGDRLDGSLRAELTQDLTVPEVRVELVRVEKFGNEGKDHSVDRVTLERDATLQANRTWERRFQLNVGEVGVPSLKTEKSSVRWLVKGVLSIRMWPDMRVEQEIGVHF